MRLYHSTFKDRDGKTCEAEKLTVEFQQGRRPRRLTLFKDRDASAEAGKNIERLMSLRIAKETPGPALQAFIEGLPDRIVKKLAQWDVLTASRASSAKTIQEHVADFKASLLAHGTSAKQAALVTLRAQTLLSGCRFKALSDIAPGPVEKWLANKRKSAGQDKEGEALRGLSVQTSNFYHAAAGQFVRWAIRERRMAENPLVGLRPLNVAVDRRHDRRALDADELRRLLESARKGEPFRGMAGTDRAVLYHVAMETGLRWNELRSLTRLSFALGAKTPTVTLDARDSKHKRADVLPLRPETAAMLREYLRDRLPTAPAFPMPKGDVGARMMRMDLANTGNAEHDLKAIQYEADERYADFHSLRHSFITALAKGGVSVATAQRLARHCDPRLTMGRYTHVALDTGAEALTCLPDFSSPSKAAAQATDTYDATPGMVEIEAAKRQAGRLVGNGNVASVGIKGLAAGGERFTKPLRYHCAKAAQDPHNSGETSGNQARNETSANTVDDAIQCHEMPENASENAKQDAKQISSEIDEIAKVWPSLPEAIREAVKSLVRAAGAIPSGGR